MIPMETFRSSGKNAIPELWTTEGASSLVSEAQGNENCACGYWKLALAQVTLGTWKSSKLFCVVATAGLQV